MFPMVSCVPWAGDNAAPPLAEQTEGGLAREVMGYAPDLGSLTFAHRLIYAADAHLSRAPRPALKCPAPPMSGRPPPRTISSPQRSSAVSSSAIHRERQVESDGTRVPRECRWP